MIARLYSNENPPLPAVEALRRCGHDVITTHDEGKSLQSIPDDEVLRFALANGRAVLTLNRRDFICLHRENPHHEGIIVCTDNPDFEELTRKVNATLETLASLRSQLVRINRGV